MKDGGAVLSPHPKFDAAWYVETYRDEGAAQLPPLLHYIEVGSKKGFFPKPSLSPLRESTDRRREESSSIAQSLLDLETETLSELSASSDSIIYREPYRKFDYPSKSSDPLLGRSSRGEVSLRASEEHYTSFEAIPVTAVDHVAEDIQTMVHSSMGSPFFDLAFYVAAGGRGANRTEALVDYFARGEAINLCPSESFDPGFYRAVYDDVAQSGVSPLRHFLRFGQWEGRYPSRFALAADGELLVRQNYVKRSANAGLRRRQRHRRVFTFW